MTENFEGHEGRECGEHRTTGGRAWCFDCSEWCYPTMPCARCELPKLRAVIEAAREVHRADMDGLLTPGGQRRDQVVQMGDALDTLTQALQEYDHER